MSESSPSAQLTGPTAVTITATLPPLPGPAGPVLKPPSIVVVNTGDSAIVISRIDCDPVRDTSSGSAMDAKLTATAETTNLASGQSTAITLSGNIPRRAGAYDCNLRIQSAPGLPLVLPVTIRLAASPFWGILCMLLGLSFVAVTNLLTGESDVHTQLMEVIQFRQDANEWMDRNLLPASQTANRDAFDRDVQRALILLNGPRPLSIVDWRIPMAQQRQHAAEDTLKTIKEAAKDLPPGAAEVSELERQWKDFQTHVQAALNRNETMPGQTGSNLPARLAAFLTGFKTRYLDLVAQAEEAVLSTQVALVDLTQSAGQSVQARQQAIEVRRWLERAAGEIDQRLRMVANYEQTAGLLLGEDISIRDRLADPALTDDQRREIAGALDQATSGISATTTEKDLAKAYEQVLNAGIHLLRLRTDATLANLKAAVQSGDADTGSEPVEQATSEDPPKPGDPPSAKIAFARRVLAAWNPLLAEADPDTRADLQARITAIEAALDRGELKATVPLYKGLVEIWTDYGLKRIRAAALAATADYCRHEGEDLRRTLTRIEATLQLVRGNPSLPAWEATVDRIRVQALAIPTEDCMARDIRRKPNTFEMDTLPGSPLVRLQTEAIGLSRTVFAARLVDAPIGTPDKLGAAQASGVQEAIDLARALVGGQRELRLLLLTPQSDWYVGRPIQLQVEGIASNWGAGVQVGVDFGGQTPPELKTAEDALKQPFTHTYNVPLTAHARVSAASGFRAGALDVTGEPMGIGAADFEIAVSPVSIARRLADEFLSIRFALALLIALLVYFWQFWSKEKTFGSVSLDYVKAFVLGVAAEAAVVKLPETLGNLLFR
jgi:hypothetical protein